MADDNGIITIEIKGLEAVNYQLMELSEDLRKKAIRTAALSIAQKIKGDALARVPRRFGFLAASLRARVSSKKENIKAEVIAGNARAWYAHLIEWGYQPRPKIGGKDAWGRERKTKRSRQVTKGGYVEGKAFLRKAAEQNFENVINEFSAEVQGAVDRHFALQVRRERIAIRKARAASGITEE